MKDILKGFSIIIIVVSCIILAAMGASVGRKDGSNHIVGGLNG